jgi:cell division septation protein DedD
VTRDYAKRSKQSNRRSGKTNTRKTSAKSNAGTRNWQWYSAGLISGMFLSFLVYLGTLSQGPALTASSQVDSQPAASEPPKPRFDFYTLLPERTMDVEPDPIVTATAKTHSANKSTEFYLLQAGAFKQEADAEARRAQLLMLNLEPRIEETSSDNGRWFRVYLGPYQSRSRLNKARSLTAGENIDTLLLKRGA